MIIYRNPNNANRLGRNFVPQNPGVPAIQAENGNEVEVGQNQDPRPENLGVIRNCLPIQTWISLISFAITIINCIAAALAMASK